MPICLECGKEFVRVKPTQRFCGFPAGCRMAYHNRAKVRGLPLTPKIRAAVQSLAAIHEITENEMACRMLNQTLNPDGKPIEDNEIFGAVMAPKNQEGSNE
jgi:hypothetical protein